MPSSALLNKILNLRMQIDSLDDELCVLLKKRQRIVDRVQKIKRRLGMPSRDRSREKEIMRRLIRKYPSLEPKLLMYIFEKLFSSALR